MYKGLLLTIACIVHSSSVYSYDLRKIDDLEKQVIDYEDVYYEGNFLSVPIFDFHRADLRGRDLRCLSFWVANFEGADLSGACITKAAFTSRTRLKGAIMRNVCLRDVFINHKKYTEAEAKDFFRRAGALVD